jgi:predicted RNase H-like HicB family nuclease
MRFYHFEIVIEKEAEDEGYSAYSPSLPGCFSNGRTIEEARRNMREAIQQHVASLLAQGEARAPERAAGPRRGAADRAALSKSSRRCPEEGQRAQRWRRSLPLFL